MSLVQVHMVISLIGIAAGLVVLLGMLKARPLGGWTALFLAATVLTCLSGFPIPHDHLLPSDIVGIMTLAFLAIAVIARYVFGLERSWRWIYAATAVLALYLNVFVGVVQAFQKLPVLSRLAPTQSEPPFVVAQLAVLAIFVILGILAMVRFRPPVARRV